MGSFRANIMEIWDKRGVNGRNFVVLVCGIRSYREMGSFRGRALKELLGRMDEPGVWYMGSGEE